MIADIPAPNVASWRERRAGGPNIARLTARSSATREAELMARSTAPVVLPREPTEERVPPLEHETSLSGSRYALRKK